MLDEYRGNVLKIALLGNTCNNNFALMRYFRDLGYDANLFLYSNEGLPDDNPIHNPEWDTWSIPKWQMYIDRIQVPNGLEAIIGRPDKFKLPPRLGSLKKLLSAYDYCIGSGITPSLFWRMNRPLDIFYPYATGIEWVSESENEVKMKRHNFEWPFRKFVYATQVAGIKNAKNVLSSCLGRSAEVMRANDIGYKLIHVPQYYNLDQLPENPPNRLLAELQLKAQESEFSVFSFMRHLWVFRDQYSAEAWPTLTKRNDWLIRGFREFVDKSNARKALLFLSNWGPDVSDSKALIGQLNLVDNVVWMPILPRREISFLLARVADLGVGEFICSNGEPWGSTGWECLSAGIPFLESINYSQSEFHSHFGFDLPPFLLNVQKPEDVSGMMLDYFHNKGEWKQRAKENAGWFNENNGISLARRWIDLLISNTR